MAGGRVILTVTLNAALDVTYHVPALRPGCSHRVSDVAVRAGGKGVNVARVLHALGHDVVVTGFAGGREIQADLAAAGLREALVELSGAPRRTVTVVSAEGATVLNEPGARVSVSDWARFVGDFHALADRADVVVLSGSLPPGLPTDAYAQLIGATRTPAILDTSGAALLDGVAAGPAMVKPNAEELAEVMPDTHTAAGTSTAPGTGITADTSVAAGTSTAPGTGVAAGARAAAGTSAEVGTSTAGGTCIRAGTRAAAALLRERGAGAVVASLGAGGLLAVTADGVWRARAEPLRGNPTGAGDACVAALAVGLATGADWPSTLADAVALSAAAVVCPVAGDVDLDIYRRLGPVIEVEELDAHADR